MNPAVSVDAVRRDLAYGGYPSERLAMKSITMWTHGGRRCTFVYGGTSNPVIRLVEGTLQLREEVIAPGAAVARSEIWAFEDSVLQLPADPERVATPLPVVDTAILGTMARTLDPPVAADGSR